ncbi:MAG: hypothetical protein J7621_29805 [Niastella sp.]|nr:hypothetical protein [Niastella sp.]
MNKNDPLQPDILIFPIIIRNCDWRIQFPEIEKRATLILPGDTQVLRNASKEPDPDSYKKMLEMINTQIR